MKKLTFTVVLSLLLFGLSAFAQSSDGVLHGVVKDTQGYGIPGAVVMPQGTNAGAVADIDGNFSISIPAGTKAIDVSCLGYTMKSVALTGADNITIILEEDSELIDATVVVGYGTQKKSDLTGALSVVAGEQIQDRSSLDVAHMLQGVVPGLTVSSSNGRPGQAADINIRGWNSINGGSPLVLIDGVEGDLQRLNPQDVESISVIKDAAAAAVYGGRASFGVILVTTKSGSGQDSKPTVNYSGRFGFTAPTTCTDYETRGYYNVLINNKFFKAYAGSNYASYSDADMEELWARRNDVVENPDRPWTVVTTKDGKEVYNYYANTDWYHWMFNDIKPTQSHSLSLTGGSKGFKYLLSGGYNKENGMFRADPDIYRKYNLRSKMSLDVTKWLNISDNASFFRSTYDYPGISGVQNVFSNMHNHALASFPTENPDGTSIYTTQYCGYQVMDGAAVYLNNPDYKNSDSVNNFSNTVEVTIKPIKQLEIKGNYTYTFYNKQTTNRSVNSYYSGAPGVITLLDTGKFEDKLTENASTHQFHAVNVYATYTDTFADAHHLKVMGGFNYETKHLKDISAKGYNLLSTTLNDLNLVGDTQIGYTEAGEPLMGHRDEVSGGQNEYAIAGFFGRINYDYKDKYLVEISGRYDGSSRFASASRWGFFPSASVGWKISEENFWNSIKKTVNLAKIRYSYGSLGNQQVGYYDYIRTVSLGKQSYLFGGDKSSYASISAPNASNLTWETVFQHNLGVDLGLFNNRLTFTGEAYIRDTKDMLAAGIALPAVYGAASPKMNNADLRTKGWEISLNWRDRVEIAGHPMDYNVGFNLNDFVSHITKFDNPECEFAKKYWVGMKYGDIWGYHIEGLFKSDEEARERPVDQSIVNGIINACAGEEKGLRAGDLIFADLNGNGKIDEGANTLADSGDRRVIGNSQPRFQYGINLGLRYFGFDLSIFLQGVGHQDWYPSAEASNFWSVYNRPYNTLIPKNFLDDCWSEDNPDAYFPRQRGYVALSSSRELGAVNDRYLQNIAYCRLKNLTFGYTIPQKVLDKIKMKQIRVYFTGENLAYICPGLHSKYIDPEMASAGGQLRIYPWQKTFMFGIDLSF